MSGKQGPRPGGRSARVQACVHHAVRELLSEMDRAEITVPSIAVRAGVTPSTIYRRWGGLQALLADVAVERLRPDTGPAETGSGHGDLQAWAEQYAEEMSSAPGREMIRDVLGAENTSGACRCWGFTRQQIAAIAERAAGRGEIFPDVETIMDRIVAPVLSRILFDQPASPERIAELVRAAMEPALAPRDLDKGPKHAG